MSAPPPPAPPGVPGAQQDAPSTSGGPPALPVAVNAGAAPDAGTAGDADIAQARDALELACDAVRRADGDANVQNAAVERARQLATQPRAERALLHLIVTSEHAKVRAGVDVAHTAGPQAKTPRFPPPRMRPRPGSRSHCRAVRLVQTRALCAALFARNAHDMCLRLRESPDWYRVRAATRIHRPDHHPPPYHRPPMAT